MGDQYENESYAEEGPQVNPAEVTRKEVGKGITNGAIKGALYAGIGVAAITAVSAAMAFMAGTSLLAAGPWGWLVGAGVLGGGAAAATFTPVVPTLLTYGAGIVAAGAGVGALAGGTLAYTNADEKVQEAQEALEMREDRLGQRAMNKEIQAMRFAQMRRNFEASQQAGAEPQVPNLPHNLVAKGRPPGMGGGFGPNV